MRAPYSWFLFLTLFLLPLEATAADNSKGDGLVPNIPPADSPSLVVVASRTKVNRHVRTAVRDQLEKSLSSVFDMVPSDTFARQAVSEGHTTHGLPTLAAAATIGAAIGATHVLVVDGLIITNHRAKRRTRVHARLVDVDTGHWVPVRKIRMGRKRRSRTALLRQVGAAIAELKKKAQTVGSTVSHPPTVTW
ncbi:hypothetical protein ACFL6C_01590 [Myxococcota bacterium]